MTGSGTACDDKMFKALAFRRHRIQREILKKDKVAWTAAEDREKDAAAAAQNAGELKKVVLHVKRT